MSKSKKAVMAAAIGNLLEWYDFLVYGFVASIIAKLFFPNNSPETAIILTFATFGVAFVARPIGGLIFSYYADTKGRKTVLSLIIGTMTLGVAMMVFTPTYATIGIAAPIIMLCARVLQGISAGGEFSSATAFMVEHAPAHRRGLYGGWQMASQGLATVLAGIVGTAVTQSLSPEDLMSWGWRLPFVFGLLIGPVGLYIRRNVDETPEFEATRASGAKPSLSALFTDHWRALLIGTGLVVGSAASNYPLIVFFPTYAVKYLGLDLSLALPATIVSGLTLTFGSLLFGHLSDLVGRRLIMFSAAALIVLVVYPAFQWVSVSPSFSKLIAVQFLFALLLSGYWGPFSTAMAELFPAEIRSTGMALSYNVGVLLFGGFAPVILIWLIEKTGALASPSYYVVASVMLAVISSAFIKAAEKPGRHAAAASAAA